MDSNVQPSFIPKRPVVQPGIQQKHSLSFFSIIAIVVFITTILLAGGVYLYKRHLISQLEDRKAKLGTELQSFEPALVQDLYRLDSRINSAQELMNKHIALSTFFPYLGKITLKNVRFSSFSFTQDDKLMVNMDGEAQSFTSVANQTDTLKSKEVKAFLPSVTVTDPNLTKNGYITFAVSATLDPQSFSYGKLIKSKGILLTASPLTTTASSTPVVVTSSASSTSSVTGTTTPATSTSTPATTKSTKTKTSTTKSTTR